LRSEGRALSGHDTAKTPSGHDTAKTPFLFAERAEIGLKAAKVAVINSDEGCQEGGQGDGGAVPKDFLLSAKLTKGAPCTLRRSRVVCSLSWAVIRWTL